MRALHVRRAGCLPQKSFIDKAATVENIASDSYLNYTLSRRDEWEPCFLVHMYTSCETRGENPLLYSCLSDFTLANCTSTPFAFMCFAPSWFLRLRSVIFPRRLRTPAPLLFRLNTASLAEWQLTQGRSCFNSFHSAMNIQCKQFLCVAVKSHVCLLEGCFGASASWIIARYLDISYLFDEAGACVFFVMWRDGEERVGSIWSARLAESSLSARRWRLNLTCLKEFKDCGLW